MPTWNSIDDMPVAGFSLSTLRISIADMISLNVRTRGKRNILLPEVLYQSLPEKALALMSTLPREPFAISIPGANSLSRGYPIQREPATTTDGFTVIYSRKQNGRYEADAVKYHNKEFPIGEFIGVACQWIEQYVGSLKAIPGRYVYVAPSREEWEVILRDSGFTGWDPSRMPSENNADLRAKLNEPQSSALSIRVPLYSGDKQFLNEGLPVFAQVEVMHDPDSGPRGAWISFAEYRQNREIRERLPESISSEFREWLNLLTEESGFKYWIFNPGMSFGDRIEWWGDCSRRRTEHEGIDFALGFLPESGICRIPEGTPVRSMADGEVTAILDDFIGKTVVVRHASITRPGGDVFHTLLSHIQPLVAKSGFVSKGEIIGRVGKLTRVRVPAHLHLAGAWFPEDLAPDKITIDHIHPAFDPIALADFKDLMQDSPLCRWNPHEARVK